MKTLVLLLLALCTISTTQAQTELGEFLLLVEKNNPNLIALRKKTDAEKLLAETGLTPDNPTIAYKYMPGNANNGTLHNFTVSQTLEFPTVYSSKRALSGKAVAKLEAEYENHRRAMLLEAQQTYIEAVYLVKQQEQLQQRVRNTESLQQAWQQRLSAGDATAIELNKLSLEVSLVHNRLSQNRIAYQQTLAQLQWFSRTVIAVANTYGADDLIERDSLLAVWQQRDGDKQIAEQYLLWSNEKIQLAKAKRLPSFSFGYENETAAGVTYQGPSVGISIPLWRDNNTVAASEAEALYAEAQLSERQYTIGMEVAAQWERVQQTKKTVDTLQAQLRIADNTALLQKSLSAGVISVVEYFNQLAIMYDMQEEILLLEKLYYQQRAALYKVFL